MNKITFPLTMSMKRETVADLHTALHRLNFDVAAEEVEKKRYGKTTAAAVGQFQAENELRRHIKRILK